MRSSREGAASTQRLCVSQTHLAVEVARSRSRPPRVGRAAASCRLGPARHAGCQVHIAPHAEHTVGPQQGRLGLCPQEQRGTRHTGREHQRSWSLPGIQLQNVLPGESTSAAGLFPRHTGRQSVDADEPRPAAGVHLLTTQRREEGVARVLHAEHTPNRPRQGRRRWRVGPGKGRPTRVRAYLQARGEESRAHRPVCQGCSATPTGAHEPCTRGALAAGRSPR